MASPHTPPTWRRSPRRSGCRGRCSPVTRWAPSSAPSPACTILGGSHRSSSSTVGLGFPAPTQLDPDALLDAVIGPAMRRLGMTFPDRQAYRDYWQDHPAFSGAWSPWADAYIQRDLVGAEPRLRSSCVRDAVRVDGTQVLCDPEVLAAVGRLKLPARLLWADRGLMDEPQGLYDEQRLAAAGLDPARLTTRRVADVNHYTVLIGDDGARTVAGHLLDAAGVSGGTAGTSGRLGRPPAGTGLPREGVVPDAGE